jgi:hypothetical protein
MLASSGGFEDAVKLLLNLGASVHYRDQVLIKRMSKTIPQGLLC